MKSLKHIEIKVDGNFVAVTEPFSDDIYKIAPRYEIPNEFFEQSTVKKTLRIWRILCSIAFLLLIIAIILTTVLNNGIYLITGVIIVLAVNIPVAIITAVCFIKWMKSKK